MPKYAGVSPETLAKLKKYDTPTICNVVELWDMRSRSRGYMDKSIMACYPKLPPMVGYALTTTFRSMEPPKGLDAYAGIAGQLEVFDQFSGPPVLVFQDLDQPCASATFGEVMCTTYKQFGASGLITSGTGRDLEQVAPLDFPCFTSGSICAHGYCHMLHINVPVTVGGMAIFPGELLHGDLNGITTIPVEVASEVPDACDELAAAEKIILDYVKGPNINPKGFAEARKACGAKIAELANRLKSKKLVVG